MSSIISLAAVGTQLSAISDGPDNVVRLSIRKQNNFDIFVSYFPEDQKYWDEARKFLTYARRSKARIYSFDDVRPGRNLPAEAQAALFSSVIAILLISQDYVDSPLMESEFPHLLERAKNEGTLILTLHVGTFDTYGLDAFMDYRRVGLKLKKPLKELIPAQRDKVYLELGTEVRRRLQEVCR